MNPKEVRLTPTRIEGHRVLCAALLPALSASALLCGCGKSNQYQPPPPPAVTVSKPLRLPVTDYLQATGSVAASRTVDLVARVEGYLRTIAFTDGSPVKAGQLLFVIEPEPYQAKLASQQAQLLNAQSEYDRQLRMIKENATSQANVEKWRSQRDQAAAAVELAKINLSYTRITAPFAGRIGRHLIDTGNLVGGAGAATKLATIEQVDPAWVYFSVNERDVLRVRAAALAQGEPINGQVPRIAVGVGLQTEDGYPHAGTLDFAGTGIDTGSGTLQVRAVVPNGQRVLLPGLFARLRIPLSEPTPRLMVPDRVVGYDQVGSYVLVVSADHRVMQQRIETGPLQDGLRAVLSGLEPDSEVIVDGLQRAVPGDAVTATEQPLTAPGTHAGATS
jgi:RND family efflux transporter MFP subunit